MLKGIYGFESGGTDLTTGSGVSVTDTAARTGAYGFLADLPTPSALASAAVLTDSVYVAGLMQPFDYRARVFFKVLAYPSSAGIPVVQYLRGTFDVEAVLQMNTTGQIRMVHTWASAYSVPSSAYTSAYSGVLALDTWYRADYRIYGHGGDATYIGRQKSRIDVYEADTDVSVFSSVSPTQRDRPSTIGLSYVVGTVADPLCSVPTPANPYTLATVYELPFYLSRSPGWLTVVPLVISSMSLEVWGATEIGGAPSPVFDSSSYAVATDNSAENSGSCYKFGNNWCGLVEHGLFNSFNNESIDTFLLTTAAFVATVRKIVLGENTAGVATYSRRFAFDDVYWEVGYSSEVNGSWPTATHVYAVLPTDQDASDDFTPSGAVATVATRPPGGDEISSTVLNAASTYRASDLVTGFITDQSRSIVHHSRYYTRARSAGNRVHALLVNGVEMSATNWTSGITVQQVDVPVEATVEAFLATTFGVKQKYSGDLFRVSQIIGEVLADVYERETPLGDATMVLSWIELTDSLGTVHVWSTHPLPDPASYFHGYKEPRVQEMGVIRRALSDFFGSYEGTDFSFVLDDTDRAIRALLANASTRYLTNRPVVVRTISDEGRRALLMPQTIVRGYVREYSPGPNLTFSLAVQDILAGRFSLQTDKNQIPQRVVEVTDFDRAASKWVEPAELPDPVPDPLPDPWPPAPIEHEVGAAGLAVPFIYGTISAEHISTFEVPDGGPTMARDLTLPAPSFGVLSIAPDYVNGTLHFPVSFRIAAMKAGAVGVVSAFQGEHDTRPRSFQPTWNTVAGADGYILWQVHYPAPYEYAISAWHPFDNPNIPGIQAFYKILPPNMPARPGATFPDHSNVWKGLGNDHTEGCAIWAVVSHLEYRDTGRGSYPLLYVGDRLLAGVEWRELLIAGHACKQIHGVYMDDVAVPTAAYGVDLLVPGFAGWSAVSATNYVEYNGHRYTVMFAKGVYGERARSGDKAGLTINVSGIDSVGDGTGTLITDLHAQYLHAIQNWILGNYQTGAWLPTTTFEDDPTVKLINEASFADAATLAAARVPGGYRGDFAVGVAGERITVRELVARFNVCADVNSGFNKHAQFFISMLDDSAETVTASPRLTDASDIHKDTFDVKDDIPHHYNVIPFRHTIDLLGEAVDGWWSPPGTALTDPSSILNYGDELVAPEFLLHLIRGVNNAALDYAAYAQGSLTASDVVRRFLMRHKEPPRLVTLQLGAKGADIDLGEVIRVSHYAGIGAEGWIDRPLRVLRHEYSPEQFTTVLQCQDFLDLIDGGFILGEEAADCTTVYSQPWAVVKSDSGAMQPDYWERPPAGSIGTVDPDYPEILISEAVKTIAEGGRHWLTTDYTEEDSVVAAMVALFPTTLYFTKGQWTATYKWTAVSWDEGSYHLLVTIAGRIDRTGGYIIDTPIQLRVNFLGVGGGGDALLDFEAWGWDDNYEVDSYTLSRATWVDQTVDVKIEWQCGTVVGDFDDVLPDGFVRVLLNGTTIYERLDFDFYIDYHTLNGCDGYALGYYGLFGNVSTVEFCIEAPGASLMWPVATTEQRVYGFLGDETTGTFSTGDPAKRLG